MTRFDVTLVTYSEIPDLTPDDRLLAAMLDARGLRVRAAVWSDPGVDWACSVITILRSTWDYFHHIDAFLNWVGRVDAETILVNGADVVRWNHHKRYLSDLERRGVPIVPTRFVERGSDLSLGTEASALNTSDVVVKPAISGAAFGARRFDMTVDQASGEEHLAKLCTSGTAMVQPFVPSVLAERERSLVFFGGIFSHAFLKAPFSAGAVGGMSAESAFRVSTSERELAKAVLNACGFDTTYARIDLAPAPDGPMVMEVELIEPALKLDLAPGALNAFADAIAHRLRPMPYAISAAALA